MTNKIDQPTKLRGGVTAEDPRLGRVPQFDERSRAYNVADVLPTRTLKGRTWSVKVRLDQGTTSACVGFSRTSDLAASPAPIRLSNGNPLDESFAQSLYHLAQRHDQWPGEDYEGSSVLGGLKAARSLGFIGEFRWSFNIDDYLAGIAHVSPGISGTIWYNSMFDPLPSGELVVDPSSGDAGGHAFMIRGVIVSEEYKRFLIGKSRNRNGVPLMRLTNSWGKSWGINGEAFAWADDYERYLMPKGEQSITTTAFHR